MQLQGADWIVLPGSKATASDLAWLRAQGLDAAITAHARAGGRVLGICGGLQMLGAELRDPHGVESGGAGGDLGNSASVPGLGLLPLATTFAPRKTVRRALSRYSLPHRYGYVVCNRVCRGCFSLSNGHLCLCSVWFGR